MPDVIQGSVRSDQVLQDRKPISMEAFAYKLDDNVARFIKLMQVIGGIESKGRTETKFRELRLRPLSHQVTSAFTSGDTTLNITNADHLIANDVLYVPSLRKWMAVVSTPASGATSVTVRKINTASGTGPDFNVAAGATILNLQESHAEGASIPAARAVKQEVKSAYIYQFDDTIKHTDIEINEDDYGQSKLDEDRELEMIHRLRALNVMMYTGLNIREALSDSGGARRHIPAGLEYYLFSTAVDASAISGGLTLASMGEIVRLTKNHAASSEMKMALCGSNAYATFSAMPLESVRVDSGKNKEWGVTVRKLCTAFGDLSVSYDSVLSPENALADRMFILDMNKRFIQQVQLKGLPLVMKRNINGDTDPHNVTDLITGTRGMTLKLPELHREVYNIT